MDKNFYDEWHKEIQATQKKYKKWYTFICIIGYIIGYTFIKLGWLLF
jgi:hypothetical protein